MLCAIVNNNVVTAIETLDPNDGTGAFQDAASSCQILLDITNTLPQPQVGWIFNGSTLISNGAQKWVITVLAFRERFAQAELMGVLAAIAAGGTESFILQMLQQNVSSASYIDLSRSDTQAGVNELVALGLLTSGRANTILTTPPAPTEIPQGMT